MANPESLRKKANDYRNESARLQQKAAELDNQANKEAADAQQQGSSGQARSFF